MQNKTQTPVQEPQSSDRQILYDKESMSVQELIRTSTYNNVEMYTQESNVSWELEEIRS